MREAQGGPCVLYGISVPITAAPGGTQTQGATVTRARDELSTRLPTEPQVSPRSTPAASFRRQRFTAGSRNQSLVNSCPTPSFLFPSYGAATGNATEELGCETEGVGLLPLPPLTTSHFPKINRSILYSAHSVTTINKGFA